MKPLVVGRPTEASVSDHEEHRVDRQQLGEPAVGLELARVAALVDHADHQEEAAGDQAVADHLDHRALDAEQVEAQQAEHHVAEVADRRVGDDLLDVGLHQREARAVDDADAPPAHQHRRDEPRSRRERAGSRAS